MPQGSIVPVKTTNLNTGAGTDIASVVAIGLPKSSGGVVGGTSTDPLRIDPTGTTVQPINDNGGSITVDGTFWQATQPVSATALPLPTGAATAANQATANTSLASLDTKLGEVQSSPTANTVLDRLKAIATALAGTLTVATHAVTQSGTWTVQPGNTANTTAWKVDGSAATQPVSVADGSDAATGAKADSVASTDTGTFSLIALFKLSLTKLTTISTNIATLAGAVTSSILAVAISEKTLTTVTGTISTSGDNTIIAAQGAGVKIKIVSLRIQNESSTASTAIYKDGTTAIGRVLGQNQGDGFSEVYPAGRPIVLSANTLFAINLSGANSHGYSVRYFAE